MWPYDSLKQSYKQSNSLKPAEQQFVCDNLTAAVKYREAASKALNEARARFPQETLHNGVGDAFRHCYWNSLMARYGDAQTAAALANAHETGQNDPMIEVAMDLHNNAKGRAIGTAYPNASDPELAMYVIRALNNDELLVIVNNMLVKSKSLLPFRPVGRPR